MPLITFDQPFKGGLSFYTGKGNTSLVPDVFPVAINGRPYLIDTKSQQFGRRFDQRVRDSQDSSTAPGEAAINPQGLWRRGQASWHYGAGQRLADDGEQQDFRFWKSKGVNVWTKGQVTLLNDTKLSLSDASSFQKLVVNDGYVYVAVGQAVKYTSDPFATSPSWSTCTGGPATTDINAIATDGSRIFVAFTSDGIRTITPATAPGTISTTKFVNTSDSFYMLGFAKGFMFGAHDEKLRSIAGNGSTADIIEPTDTAFKWVGVATGQSAVYAAGYSGKKSLVYKVTITDAGLLNKGSVALELPTGEVATSIAGYLGYIIVGTNKGVRVCTTDGASNLVAGATIGTTNSVYGIASQDRFAYFGWSNYDGVSGGLGRLDLSAYTAVNTPAYATDLMYASTANVTSVVIYDSKPLYTIAGVGVIALDSNNVVASGTLETGIYRWGIPDRKFAPRFDTRCSPLVGSISVSVTLDDGTATSIGTHSDAGETENTYIASETKFIEAAYTLTLTRSSGTSGPTLKRWMARAYAAPARSRLLVVPVIIHQWVHSHGKDYALDVEYERDALEDLVLNPRIVTYQENGDMYSVIVEDVEWQPLKSSKSDWLWEGTAVVTMRTITD